MSVHGKFYFGYKITLRMKVISYIILFLLVIVPLTTVSFAQIDTSQKMIQFENDNPELFNILSQNGHARIIVELDVSFSPEGTFTSQDNVSSQRDAINSVQNQLIKEIDSQNVYKFRHVPLIALQADSDSISKIVSSPFVKNIHIDKINQISLIDSVPLIGGSTAFESGFDGTGQTVAILDTGVDKTHSFFENRVVSEACYSISCPNGLSEQIGDGAAVPCPASGCEHGTHVAGIAAGNNNLFSGVAKNSNIVAIQVFSVFNDPFSCFPFAPPCTGAFDSDIIKGLERIYDLKDTFQISSANLSLGGGLFSTACDGDPVKPAIDQLRSVDIATIIASGNDGSSNQISSPACISTAISVGSTDKFDNVSSFSNSASILTLLAPGESIQSSIPNEGFDFFDGTSMATPHVTGAWAVMKQQNPSATVSEILSLLTGTGQQITDSRNGLTTPRIQIDEALGLLTVPDIITDLTLNIISSNQVDLLWSIPTDGNSDILGFQIFRSLNNQPFSPLIALPGANVGQYSDTSLSSGDRITYMVRAVNSLGPANPSNIPTPVVTLGATIPDSISNLVLIPISSNQVNLSWSVPDNGGSIITGYQIFKKLNGGVWTPLIAIPGSSTSSFSDTSLVSGDVVTYVVRAINGVGPASPSNVPSDVIT